MVSKMKKILIVEDEEVIRNELKILLENSGYQVLYLISLIILRMILEEQLFVNF